MQLKLTILVFWTKRVNLLKKVICDLKRKNCTFVYVHGRYLPVKLFLKAADRHNGILMSLLFLLAETISV